MSHDEKNTQNGNGDVTPRDHRPIKINGGDVRVKDIHGGSIGQLSNLQHCNGVNLGVILVYLEVIQGVTHALVVKNRDNISHKEIKKFPGGSSTEGETIADTIGWKSFHETGFNVSEVTYVTHVVIKSKEQKNPNSDDQTHVKVTFLVNKKQGALLSKNMRDKENSQCAYEPVKDLINDSIFNWNHKEILRKVITELKYSQELTDKHRDVFKFF